MNPHRLLDRIEANRLENIRFGDLVHLVVAFGFELQRIRGSHHIYKHPAMKARLNLQSMKGQAKPYQIRQLQRLIAEYDLKLEDE